VRSWWAYTLVEALLFDKILGKTTQAASMQMNRSRKSTAEGFVVSTASTMSGDENTESLAWESHSYKIIQTTSKTKATDSGKKRQAVKEEDKLNKGKEDSEEKKTSSVKKPKLTLGKGDAGGRNSNE
jgi:hypothetical protein